MKFTSPDQLYQHTREYLLHRFLPYQIDRFLDSDGGFRESVTNTTDDTSVPRRLLSQCRQIYQFSAAYNYFGAERFIDAANHGFNYLKHYVDRQHGGWYFSIHEWTPVDLSKDLYAHAFLLFSLSHYYSASQSGQVARLLQEVLAVIEQRMADGDDAGYIEKCQTDWTPVNPVRLQNPHMHLLEAMLAARDCGADLSVDDAIGRLVELFSTKLVAGTAGALGEYFESDWQVHQQQGHRIEPGHHFEWVWILQQLGKHGSDRLSELQGNLFRLGWRYGVRSNGRVIDEIDRHGQVLVPSHRIWAQTECVKAITANLAGFGGFDALYRQMEMLFGDFLKPDGSWTEHIDSHGQSIRQDWPATTGYHVTMALLEVLKVSSGQHSAH